MNEKKELRYLEIEEVRADSKVNEDNSKSLTIGGYASVFYKLSEVIKTWDGDFQEKIAKGAFAQSIASGDVRALWSHDTSAVLGRTKSGTLRLAEDDYGLKFDLDLPNTANGEHVYELIKRGDVSGVSFGFFVRRDMWDFSNPDMAIRTIYDVELFEISPVAFPAYEQSQVTARSMDSIVKESKEKFNKFKEKERQLEERFTKTKFTHIKNLVKFNS